MEDTEKQIRATSFKFERIKKKTKMKVMQLDADDKR